MIRPYLSDMMNDHKTPKKLRVHSRNEAIDYKTQFQEWKIQLIMSINFIFSKDFDETPSMSTKRNNRKIMMGSEIDDIIKELFESLIQKYQEGLEESMKGSGFYFDNVDLLHFFIDLSKNKPEQKGRIINRFSQIAENKKEIINPKNNDNNFFQYALTAALNYQNIKSHLERVSNLKPFIDQYNWKEIDFPAHPPKDWKKFELNYKSIALNILFVSYNTEKRRLAYKSKQFYA